jgi:hypothetical protein
MIPSIVVRGTAIKPTRNSRRSLYVLKELILQWINQPSLYVEYFNFHRSSFDNFFILH